MARMVIIVNDLARLWRWRLGEQSWRSWLIWELRGCAILASPLEGPNHEEIFDNCAKVSSFLEWICLKPARKITVAFSMCQLIHTPEYDIVG